MWTSMAGRSAGVARRTDGRVERDADVGANPDPVVMPGLSHNPGKWHDHAKGSGRRSTVREPVPGVVDEPGDELGDVVVASPGEHAPAVAALGDQPDQAQLG